MRRLVLLALCLSAPLAHAQTPGTCAPGTANARLDASDVDVRVFTGGTIGYGGAPGAYFSSAYVVPRGSGKSPVYAAFLRVGGLVGGDVRVAAPGFLFYSEPPGDGVELWPGPLNPDGTLPDPADCSAYDRVWVVSQADVAAYEAGGTAVVDLREWPVGLGAPAVDAEGQPVAVGSRDQRIDLPGGERPVLSGTQTAFWVMNDVGNVHTNTRTAPLGIEVRATAFVVASASPAFDQGVFYRFEIVNRNTVPIEAAYAGFEVDHDLGAAHDDYVATDTTRGMSYAYNADEQDGPAWGGEGAYAVPPAHGIDLLDGLGASVSRLNAVAGPSGTPRFGPDVYERMQGLWSDGSPVREGGSGYGGSGAITRFTHPGDPLTDAFWSNENRDGTGTPWFPGNVFVDLATPSFSLQPGASYVFNSAMLFAQGTDRLDSVVRLRAASDVVQAAYDAGTLFPIADEPAPAASEAVALGVPVPNPVRGVATVPYTVGAAGPVRLRLVDVLGRTVTVLAEGPLAAGAHEARVDTQALAPGVYAVVLDAAASRAVRTLTVVR